MNSIKTEIGKRIAAVRKAAGLTVKELADRTNTFSPARISNWEQGTRSPGPEEAIILSAVLGVSPSYLLCLSDDIDFDSFQKIRKLPSFVPILTHEKIISAFFDEIELVTLIDQARHDCELIPLTQDNQQNNSDAIFALNVHDKSMEPEFEKDGTLIIDCNREIKPSSYVLSLLNTDKELIVRQYHAESKDASGNMIFKLLAQNSLWPTVVSNIDSVTILGTVIEYHRYLD